MLKNLAQRIVSDNKTGMMWDRDEWLIITGSASTTERRRQSDTSLSVARNIAFPMWQCAARFRLSSNSSVAVGMSSVNQKILIKRKQEKPQKLFFTMTRCVRRIRGLPSGDDNSSVGAIHCSINSLSERARDGWLTERCSERWSL